MQFDKDSVPNTVDEAIITLVKTLTKHDVEFIDSISSEAVTPYIVDKMIEAWSIDDEDSILRSNSGTVDPWLCAATIINRLWAYVRANKRNLAVARS